VSSEDRQWFEELLDKRMVEDFHSDPKEVIGDGPLLYGDFMTPNTDNKVYELITDHEKVGCEATAKRVHVNVMSDVLIGSLPLFLPPFLPPSPSLPLLPPSPLSFPPSLSPFLSFLLPSLSFTLLSSSDEPHHGGVPGRLQPGEHSPDEACPLP